MKLTFVIPAFNERETLRPLTEAIAEATRGHAIRLLFIDDGSADGSPEVLRELYAQHAFIDVIRFGRNLGKTAALSAAFAHIDPAATDIVFTMDADLQDDPKEIPRFIEALQNGADLVVGWKRVRHDPWHKTFPSRVFNGMVARLFGLAIHDVNCGFKAMRPEVCNALRLDGDLHRLIPVLAHRAGYRVVEIPVEHHARRYGVSKYGVARFFKGAYDVFRVYTSGANSQRRTIDPADYIKERLLH